MTKTEFLPIAQFLNWQKKAYFGRTETWVRPNGELAGNVEVKTSLTPAECIEALERLVEKGEHPLIAHAKDGWSIITNCHRQKRERKAGAIYGKPTIHEAIENAILQLVGALADAIEAIPED